MWVGSYKRWLIYLSKYYYTAASESSNWKFEFTGLNQIPEFILYIYISKVRTEKFTALSKVLMSWLEDWCLSWGLILNQEQTIQNLKIILYFNFFPWKNMPFKLLNYWKGCDFFKRYNIYRGTLHRRLGDFNTAVDDFLIKLYIIFLQRHFAQKVGRF